MTHRKTDEQRRAEDIAFITSKVATHPSEGYSIRGPDTRRISLPLDRDADWAYDNSNQAMNYFRHQIGGLD